MKLCDLHTHSVFSDGTFSPEQIIDSSIEAGLSAIALTDHNTVSGLPGFMSYAKGKHIDAVPGIEFSTGYMEKELHIPGLFIKPDIALGKGKGNLDIPYKFYEALREKARQ